MSFLCMLLYEIYWIRYFKSEKTMKDFYRGILGSYILGIGHIVGIDAMRWRLRSFATGTSSRRVQSDY